MDCANREAEGGDHTFDLLDLGVDELQDQVRKDVRMNEESSTGICEQGLDRRMDHLTTFAFESEEGDPFGVNDTG